MKVFFIFLFIVPFAFSVSASEIIQIKLFDGEIVEGKLDLPANTKQIKELVIYVHGTGPNTYLNKRKFGNSTFNFFDYFSEEFNKRGIAFFVANKRGVEMSDQPPTFEKVDRAKFKKATPTVLAQDIASSIKILRQDKRLKKAKIILFGWSEGTIIAPMVAEKKNKVDALFLAGYVHENMSDVIKWQFSGVATIRAVNKILDKNADGTINKAEFEAETESAKAMRAGRSFEQFDVNQDKLIDAKDFEQMAAPKYKMVLEKTAAKDDDWIWQNYFHISTDWLIEHAKLEANKTRMLRLKMPIYIFHGEDDANCDVNWVYDLKERFAKAKKKNLQTFVFKNHDHNLNFATWLQTKTIPDGIKKIFETAEIFNK